MCVRKCLFLLTGRAAAVGAHNLMGAVVVFRLQQALAHPYFSTLPAPSAATDLPLPAGVTMPVSTSNKSTVSATVSGTKVRAGLQHGPSSASMYSSHSSLVDRVTALEVGEGGEGEGQGDAAMVVGEGEGQAHKKLRSV
jgi:hypothetical protein